MNFKDLKSRMISNFNTKVANHSYLFYVEIDRERVWEEYLNGFEEEEKQAHNCNACKSFIRQYSGITFIDESYNRSSIWDFDMEGMNEVFIKPIENLRNYINSLPVTDIFINSFPKLGTDTNRAEGGVTWNHFYLYLPQRFLSKDVDAAKGTVRSMADVFKNSLDKVSIESLITVSELIDQNSLYRGIEFKNMVKSFLELSTTYFNLPEDKRTNFIWSKASNERNHSVLRIKNTAIGTLLLDISNDKDLEQAVAAYERVVAPTNYKRPAPIITERMIKEAQTTIEDLGYLDSLERRYANSTDIDVNNVLFTDRSSTLTSIFDDMKKDVQIDSKVFNKVEEVTIEKFIRDILPSSKMIELYLENKHMNNMVSLLTATNNGSKSLFKWDNNFSWNYTNGVTDSIKERVKEAGGKVEGELRASLSWYNCDDLDIHMITPLGRSIYFSNKRDSYTKGQLDVDMNAGNCHSTSPVENIIFPEANLHMNGTFTLYVNNYNRRSKDNQGFVLELESKGQLYTFESNINPNHMMNSDKITFDYDVIKGISNIKGMSSKSVSKEKWGINTNNFHKVNMMMLSPNYWDIETGNKHYLFMLEGCKSDEKPRAFFNEFLKSELEVQRRAFEVLGGKVIVTGEDNQLSGVGFSSTQSNYVFVRVTGAFKRVIKVVF